MTPEELEAFRGWCRISEVPPHSLIMKALEHIDQQAAQVAALQEIAISERERRHMSDMSRLGFVLDSNACPDPRKIAEDQLAKEHPEAFR